MSHFKAKMHKVQFPQLVKQAAINSVVASFVKLFSSCIGNIQTKYCVPSLRARPAGRRAGGCLISQNCLLRTEAT